jgi:hypothetical protein
MKRQHKLLSLVAELQRCGSRNGQAMQQTVSEVWETLRRDAIGESNPPSRAALAAVVVQSKVAAQLLTADEHEQLLALADLVLDRYEQRTKPPNKLGKLIAGIVKEL